MNKGVLPLIFAVVLTTSLTGHTRPHVLSYRVNTASFANELASEGGDPISVIENAASSWSTYAGSNLVYEYGGPTSLEGCGAGWVDPHVWGTNRCPSDCPDDCNCLLGNYFKCIGSGFTIQIWLRAADWRLQPTDLRATSSQWDLQRSVAHEFGHDQLAVVGDIGHVDPSGGKPCLMNTSTTIPITARGFCSEEIRKLASRAGFGTSHVLYTSGDATQPGTPPFGAYTEIALDHGVSSAPIVSTWNSSAGHLGTMLYTSWDYSLGSDAFGTGAGRVYSCDHQQATCSLSQSSNANIYTNRRPSLAYDSTRQIWYAFAIDDAPTERVAIYASTNRVDWSFIRYLPSGPSTLVETRYPVAAAYDLRSDSLIVLVNAFTLSPGAQVLTAGAACPATGCAGDVVLYRSPAGSAWSGAWDAPRRFASSLTAAAYGGYGSPALTCVPTQLTTYDWYTNAPADPRNCIAAVTGSDPGRWLYVWRFGYDSAGVFQGYSPAANTGGKTVGPISLSSSPWTHKYLMAVRGLGNRRIYLNGTNHYTDPLYGWSELDPTGPELPAESFYGPSVAIKQSSPWEITFDN